MLVVTLPLDHQKTADCRINGQPAKVEFLPMLQYKHEGGEWKTFHVRQTNEGPNLVTYYCTETPDEEIVLL